MNSPGKAATLFALFAGEDAAHWLIDCDLVHEAHEVAQNVSSRLRSPIVVAFGRKDAVEKRCCVFRDGIHDTVCESGWTPG
jgi:hypothetical protein